MKSSGPIRASSSRKLAGEVSREIRTLSEARATAISYLRWRNVSSQWMDEGAEKMTRLTTEWAKVAVETRTPVVGLAVHTLAS
jgi:hypothetical protein